MPKVLSKEMKTTAYRLYMKGLPITQIYEELLKKYPKEKFVRSTVYSWPKIHRWDEDKSEFRVKAKEDENEFNKLMSRRDMLRAQLK